jgi:hypothetical protein
MMGRLPYCWKAGAEQSQNEECKEQNDRYGALRDCFVAIAPRNDKRAFRLGSLFRSVSKEARSSQRQGGVVMAFATYCNNLATLL